ncbi:MAG TPA: molybdate ABC transporter permease subunit [Thermoanaerobaculia bacterium]|nr:molybdate ABC transporter permease subunit [Thermoanaerobaculia bacterium]
MVEGESWIVAFTVAVAALGVLVILPPGVALAWVLARHRFPGKALVETLVALPLVMPPVATGLILLKVLGRRGPVGSFLYQRLNLDVVFTWRAVVIAMAVMSFPLLVRTARVSFEKVDPLLEKSARTLGASRLMVFFRITLPLASSGVMGGTLLAFARALGEFGATILVAGSIPGRTTTLSLAIYNLVQLGKDDQAFRFLAWAVGIAFVAVWCGEAFLRRTLDTLRT